MSQTLYWQPRVEAKQILSDTLKHVLLNGSFGFQGASPTRRLVRRSERGYFQALADAKVDGAQAIFDALDEHDTIELWVE